MVLREISITRFLYDRLRKGKQPVTILVVGQNDDRRKALCNTILKNVYPEGTSVQEHSSPFVYYEGPELRLLAVREVGDNVLSKKCGYVVLMEDATELRKIWEATDCKEAVAKFETFKTIFHNCAKDCEVLWIDARTDSPVPSKKMFWSAYTFVEDIEDEVTRGVLFNLPEKISHLNEKDDDEDLDGNQLDGDGGSCTIL